MLASMALLFGLATLGSIVFISEDETDDYESERDSPQGLTDGSNDALEPLPGESSPIADGNDDSAWNDNIGNVYDVDQSFLEQAPDPLDDWTQSPNFPVLTGDQTVAFDFPQDMNGSLFSIEANYSEDIQIDDEELILTNVGKNVYFLPEGVEFPREYLWSVEGNSLFNTETHTDDPERFGGIKLIARLDGGSFISSWTDELVRDNTVELPTILSNLVQA